MRDNVGRMPRRFRSIAGRPVTAKPPATPQEMDDDTLTPGRVVVGMLLVIGVAVFLFWMFSLDRVVS